MTLGGVGTDVLAQRHAIIRIEKERVELLGKMQRFRDQGEACRIGDQLVILRDTQEAAVYYTRAEKVAEAHGFFSVLCKACIGLGNLAFLDKRDEDAVKLLRNALIASPLSEDDAEGFESELCALGWLINALLNNDPANNPDEAALDELEQLVPRFQETAKAQTRKNGRLCKWEFSSLVFGAQFHEVLCICTLRAGNPISRLSALAFHLD